MIRSSFATGRVGFLLVPFLLLFGGFAGGPLAGQDSGSDPGSTPPSAAGDASVQDPPGSGDQGVPKAEGAAGESAQDDPGVRQWPQNEEGWFIITPEGSGAEFIMPLSPRETEQKMVPVPGTTIHVRMMAAVDDRQANFVFAWHDQKEPKTGEEVKNTLDGAVKGALGMTFGELEKAIPLNIGGLPGCEYRIRFHHREQPMRILGRVFLFGTRVYQLTYVAPDSGYSETAGARFVQSFVHHAAQMAPGSK